MFHSYQENEPYIVIKVELALLLQMTWRINPAELIPEYQGSMNIDKVGQRILTFNDDCTYLYI